MIVLVCLESPEPSRASHAALSLARQLAANAQIVALSAGGPVASASLELARQGGVHRVIQFDEPALDRADFFTLGMVLAEAARHIEATLIIAGEHSDHEGQGLVPAALAHHLGSPIVTRVQNVEQSTAVDDAVVLTVRAGGRMNRIEMALPLVLSTSIAPYAAPVASHSSRPGVETITFAQLGLDHSRVVPRPDLLGTRVPLSAPPIQYKSFEEVAQILLRR